MKKAFALSFVVLGLMMVGCSAKPSLVGKWKGQVEAQGQVMDAEIEVTADKMISVFQAQGMTITGTSSYKMEGDKITSTVEDIKLTGGNIPPAAQAMFDAAIAKEKGKSDTSTVVFKDNDTAELTGAQGTKMTWTRVK